MSGAGKNLPGVSMSASRNVQGNEESKRKYLNDGNFRHRPPRSYGNAQCKAIIKDTTKRLANISLVPVTSKKEFTPELSDIEVYLSSKELDLSLAFQRLRLTLKKCCKVKRYDIIPLNLARTILMDTANELPSLKEGINETVEFIHMDDGFNRFFLQFKLQRDRLNMINLELTDLIRFNKLKRVQYQNCKSLRGQNIVVRKPGHNLFVRGCILESVSSANNKVIVSLQDYGMVEEYDLDSAYELPSELADVPSLCFPAYLHNFCPDEDDSLGLLMFRESIADALEIRCQIVCVYESNDQKIYGVWLFAIMGDNENEVDIGDSLFAKLKDLGEETVQSRSLSYETFRIKELALLMYSDQEVNIQDYSVSVNAHCSLKLLYVLNVISPGQLILQHAASDGESLCWFDVMQQFYNNAQLCQPFQIKTSRVFQNRCYVWCSPKDKIWNRVRVLTESSSEVLVWALDLGYSTIASIGDMMEISPKYCMSTALAFRGHLMHIKPINSRKWTNDVLTYLKIICSPEKLFHGVVLEGQVHCPEDKNDFTMSYGLVLAEASDQNRGTIQARVVAKRLAFPCGPCAGRHDLAYMATTAPYYSRKELLESLDGSPFHSGANSRHQNRKVKSSSGYEMTEVIAGWKCVNKSAKAVAQKRNWATTDIQIIPFVPSNTGDEKFGPSMYDHIPEVMQNRMGYVTISFEGLGPDCFYIQMQNKWTELDMMMTDLQIVAEKMPILHGGAVKPGMIAVARSVDQTKFSFWGRVVISSNFHASTSVNAIFVDFGFELPANLSSVRQLPEYFERIPPFCSRAHLDFSTNENPLMPSGVVNWTEQSEVVWKDIICEWGKSDPIYYAWQGRPSHEGGTVQLDQFNQRLNLDRRSLKWYPGKRVKTSEYLSIDQFRDHPWLKHFYNSIGINIVYEKLDNHCDFVTFVPIWRDLWKQGFIVPLIDSKKNPFSISSHSSDSYRSAE